MKYIIFILTIFLASCASNIQTGTAKYFNEMDATHCQAVLQALPNHKTVAAQYDAKAPQTPIHDLLWTDPCRDVSVPITYTHAASDAETTIESTDNLCTLLPGKWIATFVVYNGESMPALIHPQHQPNSYVPLNIYLTPEYSEPIRVLVEY